MRDKGRNKAGRRGSGLEERRGILFVSGLGKRKIKMISYETNSDIKPQGELSLMKRSLANR